MVARDFLVNTSLYLEKESKLDLPIDLLQDTTTHLVIYHKLKSFCVAFEDLITSKLNRTCRLKLNTCFLRSKFSFVKNHSFLVISLSTYVIRSFSYW